MSGQSPARLRPSGGYRTLRSFRAATIIYDATVSFCERFISARSRTIDQMVQAARSGRQNIAEGSRAAGSSSQTELRLVGVARASLDELLLDYEDFLRQRGLRSWNKNDPEAQEVRNLARRTQEVSGGHETSPVSDRTDRSDPSDRSDHSPSSDIQPYVPWLTHSDPAVVANTIICLIHQANFLLDQQLIALERKFIEEGGYSENLASARIKHRQEDKESTLPACPVCGKPMALRTSRKGKSPGEQFWGCSRYPTCKGTRKLDE